MVPVMRQRILLLFVVSALAACDGDTSPSPSPPNPAAASSDPRPAQGTVAVPPEVSTPRAPGPPDVAPWAAILRSHVTDDGGFRYAALEADATARGALDGYLEGVAEAEPAGWPREVRLAFYIDAYNALTIRQVVAGWPVENVMEEEGFFREREHVVAGRTLTLDALENQLIRPEFGEPRIHFAVHCASAGCPPLAATPYTGANLEERLEAQTRAYLRASTNADSGAGTLEVSRVFEWFTDDFEAAGGPKAFLQRYLEGEAATLAQAPATTLEYIDWDWSLNAR